jgi:flagellin
MGQLTKEINSMTTRTKFNGQSLLNGALSTTQVTAATDLYASATTSELVTGTAAGTTQTTLGTDTLVSAISVSDAQAEKGYVLTGTASLTDTTAGTLTLNQIDTSGATTGVTQTIDLSAITAGGTEDLNFSDLGVKITLSSAAGVSAAQMATDFGTATYSVDSATGSGTAVLQTGSNQGDETAVTFVNTRLSGTTGVTEMDNLSKALDTFQTTASRDNASSLITALDDALGSISSSRATLGAAQNRLQHTISNLGTTSENLSAANSRIRDVDTATESSNMSKSSVLEQAGVAVLAQANQIPQLALKLLQ